jgi:uncharacterized protein (DUF2147 family)
MNKNIYKALYLLIFVITIDVFASDNSVIGFWKTIDDKDQSIRSVVEIFEKDAKIYGKIVKIFPHEGNKPNCDQCKDEFKDQPILGMEFMWDLKKNTSTKYDGGKILDPQNGSIYKSKIELIDDGKKLNVRGYIGISLFGRSQEWLRTEKPE